MASDFDPYYRWLGIPAEEQPADHYRLLGVRRFEANAEVISNASDQRMSHLRTFGAGKRAADSQRLLNEISVATRCLLEEAKRKAYDETLRAELAAREPQPLPAARVVSTTPVPVRIPVATGHVQPPPAPALQPLAGALSSSSVVSTRRPLRRKKQNGLAFAGTGLAILLLLVGGGFYVLRNSQSIVVEAPAPPLPKPADKTKPGDKAKPAPAKTHPKTSPLPAAEVALRTAWFYPAGKTADSRGAVVQTAPEKWRQTDTMSEPIEFAEAKVTATYIELVSATMWLRLFDDHLHYSRDGRRWIKGQQGNWVKPTEIAALLSPTPPVENDPLPTTVVKGGKESPAPNSLPGIDPPQPATEPTSIARVALPTGKPLELAEAKVADHYGARIKTALKPEDKQTLARELLTVAASDDDVARTYALLKQSQRLASLGMDVSLSIEVVKEVGRRFDVPENKLLAAALAELAPKTLPLPQRDLLVREAMGAAIIALRSDDVPAADALSIVATSAAAKGKDAEQKKRARVLREHVVDVEVLWKAKQEGLRKLAASPEDAAANLAVGRYFAFALGDFTRGAEHFIRANDEELAAAGRQQLATSDNPADRFVAAAAWHQVLGSLKPVERLAVQQHVLAECQELESQLGGLPQAEAAALVKELTPLVAEAAKSHPLASQPPQLSPGLITRLLAGTSRNPTPYLAVVRDAQELQRLDTMELLRPFSTTVPLTARFALLGVMVIERDMEVLLQFEDCTCTIGARSFQAGSRVPVNTRVPMTKGVYPIMIYSLSSSFQFRVTNADTLASLLFHDERMLEMELAKIVPLPGGASAKGRRID